MRESDEQQPDVVLPGQRNVGAQLPPGERQLWTAVLEQAVNDARGHVPANDGDPRVRDRFRAEARQWIRTVDHELGGWDGVCAAVGLDPTWMREGLERGGLELGELLEVEVSMSEVSELVDAELAKIGPRQFVVGDIAMKLPQLPRHVVATQLRRLAEAGRLVVVKRGGPRVSSIYARKLEGGRREAVRPAPAAEPAPRAAALPPAVAPRQARRPSASPVGSCPACGEAFAATSDVSEVDFDLLWNGNRVPGEALEGQPLRMSSCFRCLRFFVSLTISAEVLPRAQRPLLEDARDDGDEPEDLEPQLRAS